MQFLLLFFKSMLFIYLAVWVILLVLCFRKKEFWPVTGDSRTTKYFWLATFVFMNPVLTVLYFFFGQIRSPRAKANGYAFATVLAFVIVGFYFNFPGITHLWLQPFLGRSTKSSHFNASLAAIKSADNTNTSSTVYASSNSRLACRSVAVFCEDNNVLMYRVGNYLKEFIKEISNVETVEYYNLDSPPLPIPSPDIFIRLNSGDFKENFLPYVLKLQADIHASISNHAMSGAVGYYYNRTQPIINYSIDLNLTHKSETIGYESRKYDLAAKDIAKQIKNELEKNLKKWQEKHGLLPDIPEDFYGKYKNNVLPEPFDTFELTKLYAYSGLIKHNETFWRMDVAEDVVEQLIQLLEQMEELGWKKISGDLDERFLDMRLEKENRLLHIFKPREENPYGPGTYVMYVKKEKKETPAYLYICDEESLSDEELYPAIDKLFEEPVNIELVILFEKMFNNQQREKFFELLQNRPLASLDSQIRLAEMYEGKQMFEQARQALIRAVTISSVTLRQENYKTRLENLAKKLGDEKLVEQPPERQVLLDMGCIEITENTQSFTKEAGPGEQVILFSQEEDGKIHTLFLNFTPANKPKGSFTLSHVDRKGGDKSWGSQAANRNGNLWHASYYAYDFPKDFGLNCEVNSEENSPKYLMSFELYNRAGH